MSDEPFRYRGLAVGLLIFACVVGGLYWLETARKNADRQAVRNAYLDGRLSLEEARDILGSEVDELPRPQGR